MVCLMKFILLVCLCVTRMSALFQNFLPEKFVIAERKANVTLTCKTDKDKITWRHEYENSLEDISQTNSQILSGRDLTMIDMQEDLTGNYTCWSDRGLEDYTYLLLDMSKEDTAVNINCTAETFSCTEKIKCAWTSSELTDDYAFRIRNARDNGEWVSQSVDRVFLLPHSTNLYSEESERLLITGEAVSPCCYIKTDYRFYLRDIIKPENPNISICNLKNEGSDNQVIELEVEPPSNWPEPQSFFPLKHQIEYEIRHDGKLTRQEWEGSKIKVEGSITKLRVRSRDLLLLSQWSEWSEWKNVTKGGRTKEQRKKERNKKKKTRKNKRNKKTKQKNNKKNVNWAYA